MIVDGGAPGDGGAPRDGGAAPGDGGDPAVCPVIVEVQLREDKDKLLSWPVYVTTLRAKLACAAMLLVIAPDPDVAAWARQPIELGTRASG